MLYAVSKIKVNKWNPNSMAKQEFDAMIQDMRDGGPDAIDPIKITPEKNINPQATDGMQVVLDGAHRYQGAVLLKWPKIRVEIVKKITPEAARLLTYKKNQERGTLDPYLEAQYFQWFIDQGQTQQQIADAHNIDRTTVAKRLSLIKIDPKVRDRMAKVPHVTVSHLEPLATLPANQQREAIKELFQWGIEKDVTVTKVTEHAQRVARLHAEAEKFQQAVAKSKYQVCPTCGSKPDPERNNTLPMVKCAKMEREYNVPWNERSMHKWNLKTGKTGHQIEAVARKEKQELHPTQKPDEFPNYVRTTHTREEFLQAFTNRALAEIPNFVLIENLRIDGVTKDGKRSRIEINEGYNRCSVDVRIGLPKNDRWGDAKEMLDLSVESKEYKTADLKDYKAAVSSGYEGITNKKQADELEREIEALFRKYGAKPKRIRGTKR